MENTLSALSVDYEALSFNEWINWGDDPDPSVDDQQISDTQSFMSVQSEAITDGVPIGQDFGGWKHRACPPWIVPADDKSLEAAEQCWEWAESVDRDGNLVGYWAAASGEAITNDEHGELRLSPILIMMPQPIPARQLYDSILHGKWGYQDMDGKVVVLRKDEAQVLMNIVGGGTLLKPSQLETMRHRKRSEQDSICVRPMKRVRTIASDVEHLQDSSNVAHSAASSIHNLPRHAGNGDSDRPGRCLAVLI